MPLDCPVTYCDLIEAVRWMWAEDAVLNGLIPATDDVTNRLYEEGNAYSPSLPYVVIRDLGESGRSRTADGEEILRSVRVRIYTKTKDEAAEIVAAIKCAYSQCLAGPCFDGSAIRWGKLLLQGSGYVDKGVYFRQLQLQFQTTSERSC